MGVTRTSFQKGHIPWSKGRTYTTGKPAWNAKWTARDAEKIRDLHWNKKLSRGEIALLFGVSYTIITKIMYRYSIPSMSCAEMNKLVALKYPELWQGSNNPNWRGGIASEPYTEKFFQLREEIQERDNNTCQLCGVPRAECYRALDVHHIDYNKKNDNHTNLISLCQPCNCKANSNRSHWMLYFADLLYRRGII